MAWELIDGAQLIVTGPRGKDPGKGWMEETGVIPGGWWREPPLFFRLQI